MALVKAKDSDSVILFAKIILLLFFRSRYTMYLSTSILLESSSNAFTQKKLHHRLIRLIWLRNESVRNMHLIRGLVFRH